MSDLHPPYPVYIFYDGVCATCSLFVRFVLARPQAHRFRFLSLQAVAGTPFADFVQDELKIPQLSSVLVWKNGVISSRSEAIFVVLAELGGFGWLLLLLRLIPRFLRDALYQLIARYRYHLLGKVEEAAFCADGPDC